MSKASEKKRVLAFVNFIRKFYQGRKPLKRSRAMADSNLLGGTLAIALGLGLAGLAVHSP